MKTGLANNSASISMSEFKLGTTNVVINALSCRDTEAAASLLALSWPMFRMLDQFLKYAHFVLLDQSYTATSVTHAFFGNIVHLHGYRTRFFRACLAWLYSTSELLCSRTPWWSNSAPEFW
jgi:hypothetical protein